MECPFDLPVRIEDGGPGDRELKDKHNQSICRIWSKTDADYIDQAINGYEKFKTLLRDSTNILTALLQEHQIVDTDCPTTFSHYTLQHLTRQRKANKQALKEAEKP